ncbi:hypothetical protein RCL1_006598 [Eukaryota sp. TZLM3-RCL]
MPHLPHVDILGRPVEVDVPEIVEEIVEISDGQVCAFNPSGFYIAIGLSDGIVHVVDSFSQSVAASLDAHIAAITALTWSRCSIYLLVGSDDGMVTLWDVSSRNLLLSLTTNSPINSLSFCSTLVSKFIISCVSALPRVVVLDENTWSLKSSRQITPTNDSSSLSTSASLAIFSHCGNYIIISRRVSSSPKSPSTISILDVSGQTHCSIQVPSVVTVLQSSLSGRHVLASSDDNRARVFQFNQSNGSIGLVQVAEIYDAVGAVSWQCFAFSPNDDYLIAATPSKSEGCRLFLWNLLCNSLIKTLDGPRDGISSLSWHPTRPIVASCTDECLLLWGPAHEMRTDKWKRFLPNFEPLDENVVFSEPEDQFDDDFVEGEVKQAEEVDFLTDPVPSTLQNMFIDQKSFEFSIPPLPPSSVLNFEAKFVRNIECGEDFGTVLHSVNVPMDGSIN